MNKLCRPRRFRMLAEHFLTMYPNLNIDIDSELEQLKVRTGCHVGPGLCGHCLLGHLNKTVIVNFINNTPHNSPL